MKRRDWAQATYRALRERPAAERARHLSLAEVEDVLQMGLQALIEALADGDELRLNDLGRLWVEELPPRQVVSGLSGARRAYTLDARRVVRFRASRRLRARLGQSGEGP